MSSFLDEDHIYIEQPDGLYGDPFPYAFVPCAYCGRKDDPDRMNLCLGCCAYRKRKRTLRFIDKLLKVFTTKPGVVNESPEISTDKALLLAAASVIRERGWGTGAYIPYSTVCIMQALAIAAGIDGRWWDTIKPPTALVRVIEEDLGYRRSSWYIAPCTPSERVWSYNDFYCPGFFAAIKMLEDAAARS